MWMATTIYTPSPLALTSRLCCCHVSPGQLAVSLCNQSCSILSSSYDTITCRTPSLPTASLTDYQQVVVVSGNRVA